MKLIITGATGSLGGYLTRHFSAAGHEVMAYGRIKNPPAELQRFASYTQADIVSALQFPQADAIIHTAALSDDKATPAQLYLPNVTGTKNVAEASRHIPKFIHVSSSSVYLPSPDLIVEDMAGKQNNRLLSPYGKSKLLSEEMLRNTSRHEQCYILRARAFYGVGDRLIMPRMLKLVKNGRFGRPGKMEVKASLTHYANMAAAVEACLKADRKGIHTYNVADEQVYVMIHLLRELFTSMYGHALPEKEIKIGLLKFLAFFKIGGVTPLLVRSLTNDMVLDISKIKRELNYKAVIDFKTALPEIKNWVQQIGGPEVLRSGDVRLAWQV
ncbi:MAG: NAD(P)-dependent oxidoreductase [Bacteroidetes bacterium]|nr:NAD(P)-dependent oxidoreductase [Bacteroidota bacterium]